MKEFDSFNFKEKWKNIRFKYTHQKNIWSKFYEFISKKKIWIEYFFQTNKSKLNFFNRLKNSERYRK